MTSPPDGTTVITIKDGTTYVSSTNPFLSSGVDFFPEAEQLSYDTWCVSERLFSPAWDLLRFQDFMAATGRTEPHTDPSNTDKDN